MFFTAQELDTFYGPWTPAKIALVRQYCSEARTEHEVKVIQFLMSAMKVIEGTLQAVSGKE